MNIEEQLLTDTVEYSLAHLHREAEALEACQTSLERVRNALRQNQGDALLEAISDQSESEKKLLQMQGERTRLVNRLAVALDMPASRATLGLLQRRLAPGDHHGRLQSARRRVRSASRHVERLCRGNGALLAHRLDLTQRLLYALGAGANDRYQPSGANDVSNASSTVERNC